MFNISYKLVSQIENYNQSLINYKMDKEKLDGIFLINECGNYKPVNIINVYKTRYLLGTILLLVYKLFSRRNK